MHVTICSEIQQSTRYTHQSTPKLVQYTFEDIKITKTLLKTKQVISKEKTGIGKKIHLGGGHRLIFLQKKFVLWIDRKVDIAAM